MNRKLKSLIAIALLVFMLLPSAVTAFASTESGSTQLPGAGAYKHVAVIGVDGGGAFFDDTDTPNIDKIFENGAVTYTARTSVPSISAQSWGSLLHGVTPAYHKLTNTIAGSTAFDPESEYPSYFRVVRENDSGAPLGSFCHWSSINVGIIEDNLGVTKVSGKADETIASEAAAYVKANSPKLLFVQFDEADGAGHANGYGSQTHLETITRLDGYIGNIYAAYEEAGILEDTLFIVTADHGGTPTKDDGSVGGGHGGLTDAEMNIMIAVAGKSVVKGEIGEAEIRDIAAIVTYALGYENPESWTARVPSGIFEGVVAGERPVYIAKSLNRQHLNIPTPAEGERGYFENFINKDDLIAYLPLDGMYNDLLGSTTTSSGNLYYPQAYFGQGASLDDGYISINNTVPGTDDFAVSFWFQSSGVISDPAVISNQDWGSRANKGFSIVMQNTRLLFSMGDGSKGVKISFSMPEDFLDGWVHVAVSVNRAENTVSVAFDFKEFVTKELIEYNEDGSVKVDMTGRDISSTYPINIGQDGTGNYAASNNGLAVSLDDVMIFNTDITNETLADIENYYYCNLTPAKGEVGYITNFVTDKPLVNYLTFDGNVDDVMGNKTKANGKIAYDSGYYGKAAILDSGYVSILNHDPGLNSFTVAFYMNTEKLKGVGDPSIISNKSWQNGANPGWNLSIAENKQGSDMFVFNAKGEADGAKYTKYLSIDGIDIDNKWTHVMLVFDREANTLRILVNFQQITIANAFPSHSLTTEFPLNIGEDGTGEYAKFDGMVDEFMLFDGALNDNDIANLKNYFDKSDDYEANLKSPDTPKEGDAGYVGNYVDNEIINYLPFDNSIADVTGKATSSSTNNLNYVNGYYGNAVSLTSEYISILEHDPGMDSFTVSFWIYTDGIDPSKKAGEDPVVFGNGNWNSSRELGYLLFLEKQADGSALFGSNIGRGDGSRNKAYFDSVDYAGRWMHCVVVYDRELGQTRVIYDFDTEGASVQTHWSADKLATFTSGDPLNIGNDGQGDYGSKLSMCIDEFIVFDGALDTNDITQLAQYYGQIGQCKGEITYTNDGDTLTPTNKDDRYITDVLADKDLQLYLPMDKTAASVAGNVTVSSVGGHTWGDGYYGNAANFIDGKYMSTNFKPGADNFTIALWMKVNSLTSDPLICGNKGWSGSVSSNCGFLMYMKKNTDGSEQIKVHFGYDGNRDNRIDAAYTLPADYKDSWVHIAASIDRAAKKIYLFVNFQQVFAYNIPARFDGFSLDTDMPFNVGQDGTGKYGTKLDAFIDEFMIFGEALNATDITKLSSYYMNREHSFDETEFKHNDTHHWNECSGCGLKSNMTAHKRMENSTYCECGYNLVYSELAIIGAGLNITENINVLYYVTVPEEYEAPYMVFEFNGKTYTVNDYVVASDGKLVFKFEGVSPQMICDNITATLYAGDYYVTKDEYSVKTYCVNMLKKTTDPNLVRLLSALLAYGEKSQNYMDYDAGTATDGVTLSAGISNFAGISNNVKALVGTADPSVKWNSVALRYENAMGVRFKFTVNDPTDLELRISVNGRTTTYNVSELTSIGNGEYVVYFRGIMATEYNDAVTASFYRNGVQVGQSAVYSVNSYVYAKQLGDDNALAELVKATFNYGRAAKIYVGQ